MSNDSERQRLLAEMAVIEEQYVTILGDRAQLRREYIEVCTLTSLNIPY